MFRLQYRRDVQWVVRLHCGSLLDDTTKRINEPGGSDWNHVTLEQAQRALDEQTDQMNSDELEVLARFAAKILRGKAKHGAMNLDADTRDWAVEIQEEMTDAACYMHMREIQYERRMNAGLMELRDAVTYSAKFEGEAP